MIEIINTNFKQEHIIRNGFDYTPFDYGIDFNNKEFKEFKERHLDNKKIVEKILDYWEEARNYDFLLWMEYLRVKYPEIVLTSSENFIIFKFPREIIWEIVNKEYPDISGRIRRRFNQKKLYLPTREDIIIKRSKSEKYLKKIFLDK